MSKSVVGLEQIKVSQIEFFINYYVPKDWSLDWVYVGKIPFGVEEDVWVGPLYIQDAINPNEFRIYHRGEIFNATPQQVRGLDEQVMVNPDVLRDTIIGRLVAAQQN